MTDSDPEQGWRCLACSWSSAIEELRAEAMARHFRQRTTGARGTKYDYPSRGKKERPARTTAPGRPRQPLVFARRGPIALTPEGEGVWREETHGEISI